MLSSEERSTDKWLHCKSIPLPVTSLGVVVEFSTNCLMLCSASLPCFLSSTLTYGLSEEDDDNSGNASMQLETPRIPLLKELHCVFSLTAEAPEIFQRSNVKPALPPADYLAPAFPSFVYLNNMHFQVPLCTRLASTLILMGNISPLAIAFFRNISLKQNRKWLYCGS